MNGEEMEGELKVRRERIAEIVAELKEGLELAPETVDDWALWTDIASDLLGTIYCLDDERHREVYAVLMYLDGCERSRLKNLCWKVLAGLDGANSDLRCELALEALKDVPKN